MIKNWLKILSQARRSSIVDGGEVISEIETSNTMYTLFHVKNCFNKIILLLLLLLLLENSINRYLIKKNNYTEFIYIPT